MINKQVISRFALAQVEWSVHVSVLQNNCKQNISSLSLLGDMTEDEYLPIYRLHAWRRKLDQQLKDDFTHKFKPVFKSHSKRRPKIAFQYRLSLNAGQMYCRMLSYCINMYGIIYQNEKG